MNKLTDFAKGFIVGALVAMAFCFAVVALIYFNKREKELIPKEIIEYAEKQNEIEALREGIINSSPADFLNEPSVRGAADGAAADFDRKRDEALQRYRNRHVD